MASIKTKKTVKAVNPGQISVLLHALKNTSVEEITIKNGASSIHLIRDAKVKQKHAEPSLTVKQDIAEKHKEEPSIEIKEEETFDVLSQEVGIFMREKDTKSPILVKLRDEIKEGQTLAFIRSTGITYEVKSEFNGKLTEILVEDGQPVEYAQPLFRLKKL